MQQITSVNKRPPGKIPTTAVTNEHADAINALLPTLQHGQHVEPTHGPAFEIWLVWDAGPNGEVDKDNHQYWLRRAFLSNPNGDPLSDPPDLKEVPTTITTLSADWILATNLAERPANTGGTEEDGSHSLEKGQAVGPVWVEEVAAEPSMTRFVFNNGTAANAKYVYVLTGTAGGAVYEICVERMSPIAINTSADFTQLAAGSFNAYGINIAELHATGSASDHALTVGGNPNGGVTLGRFGTSTVNPGYPVFLIDLRQNDCGT